MSTTSFYAVGQVSIAYRHNPGTGPAIVFLPGYMSDMDGGKATALFDWARDAGRECLLLDYSGCGQSGGEFAEGSLSRWRDEVLGLVEAKLESEKVILVGSSMGGWLMLLVAMALGDRLHALVGIAAAPDFSDWGYTQTQKARLRAGETIFEENNYGYDPTPTHPLFWKDAEANRVLEGEIDLTCPVRLLHGAEDVDVPPETSQRLAEALASKDVHVELVEGGDHRLSREEDIALLIETVAAL